jgi:subtilisin family serine protease
MLDTSHPTNSFDALNLDSIGSSNTMLGLANSHQRETNSSLGSSLDSTRLLSLSNKSSNEFIQSSSSFDQDDPLRIIHTSVVSRVKKTGSATLGDGVLTADANGQGTSDGLLNGIKAQGKEKTSASGSLETAQKIKLTNHTRTWKGSLGGAEQVNLYRFDLAADRSFNLKLKSTRKNTNVVLLDSSGQVVHESSCSCNGRPRVIKTVLDAGTYYVQVTGKGRDASYELSMSRDPGSSRRTAQPLNLTANPQTIKNDLSVPDKADWYRFDLATDSQLDLQMKGLKDNANVALLDESGALIQTSRQSGRKPEAISDALEAGTYYVKVFGRKCETPYRLTLSATDRTRTLPDDELNAGIFTVSETGEVSIDYLLDGSNLQGELAIFNLKGMERFGVGSERWIQEAAFRAMGNSPGSGYTAILDKTEGARFDGSPGEPDFNEGEYLGAKTFSMTPGDQFAIMLVPNGTIPDVISGPDLSVDQRPLFSMPAANFWKTTQFAEVLEVQSDAFNQADSNIFGVEDTHLDNGSDRDYNDLIFQVRGATGQMSLLDEVVNPAKDWRNSEVGKKLVDYASLKGKGLTGRYYDNIDFTGYRGRRTDVGVNFDWGSGSPAVMTSPDTFSVRWTGQIEPLYSETYTFHTQSDARVRLWVNGQLLVDNWTDHTLTENSGNITLNAGQKYDIKLEYAENISNAAVKLLWSSASQPKEIVPQNLLYPDPTALPLDPLNGLEYRPGEILVKFKADATDEQIQSFAESYGADRTERLVPFNPESTSVLDQWRILHFTSEVDIPQIRDAIARDTAIESVELDYKLEFDWDSSGKPNDDSFGQLWGLNNTGQNGGLNDADIDAPEAWQIQKGSRDVIVAVLDTGVDYNHPDLINNIWTNPADRTHGYDFGDKDSDPMDDSVLSKEDKLLRGHGTHVAGIIGAVGDNDPDSSNYNPNVVGVSPNVSIMSLKLVDSEGNGFFRNAARAIHYAVVNGARVLNASFGGPPPNFWDRSFGTDDSDDFASMADAIRSIADSQVLFVAAADNDGKDINIKEDRVFPAGFGQLPNVITVAATDRNDQLTNFSNYGSFFVSLGAPGEDILSTVPISVDPSGYLPLPGTSMAAPHVAGAAALLLAQQPILSAAELKNILMSTVDPVASLQGKTVSGGRLNVANALLSLRPVRRVELTIHRVRAASEIDSGENDPNFWARVAINGTIQETARRPPASSEDLDGDPQGVTPQWRFPSGDVTDSQIPITIQMFDWDRGFAGINEGDDHLDINPTRGVRGLNLIYDLNTNQVIDALTGEIFAPNADGQIHTVGGGGDDDNPPWTAGIWFSVNDTVA